MAEHGVVVEVPLGIEREQAIVFGSDEGIDLGQRSIARFECCIKRGHERHRLVHLLRLDAQRKGQLARLKGLQSHAGLDVLFQNRVRIFGRNLFNLHAAARRGHKHRLAHGAINHDAEIQFAINRQSLFHQQPLNFLPFGASLVRDQIHAQHLGGDVARLCDRFGNLYSTALATSAGVYLGFDYNSTRPCGE